MATCKRCGAGFIPKLSDQRYCGLAGCHKPKLHARRSVGTELPKRKRRHNVSESQRVKADQARRWKYGLSPAEYDAMVAAQDGRCAICGAISTLFVDHDHATGKVRGLLCCACNTALGMLRDSQSVMRAAAAYMERHQGKVGR